MLITLLVLLLALQQGVNSISIKIKNTNLTGNKDIEFADILKQDLRRNNDDYLDKFKTSKLGEVVENKQSGTGKVAKTNVKDQFSENISLKKPNQMLLGKDAKRRNLDFSDEVNYNKYSFSPVTVTSNPSIVIPTINPKRFQKVTISTEREQFPNAPLETIASSNNYPEYIKKSKINKFKQFMDKNKGLIQDFISKKAGAQTTEPMPTLEASFEDEKMAQRAKSSEERLRAIPGPNQLDMAPANGGRIHAMRLKGRLCQRHVLVPEGPKYDSKGNVYLHAFTGRRRDYHQTNPPKLVLPKCCNCCKKSVLGCE